MKNLFFIAILVGVWMMGFSMGQKEKPQDLSPANAAFMTYFVSCIHQLGDPELIDRPESNPLALMFSQECYQKAEAVGQNLENIQRSYPKMNTLEMLDKALSTVKPEKVEPVQEQPIIDVIEEKPEIWI